ncbi:MAG: hypothetical protein DRI65_05920 [Chloroflexota bacterium]|nr:MAG: hypothetical protein DRI65_05920 [Chloroflexota bacterium]HDD62489.1 hypothetical protein [Chloroflexota bacterium]
MLKAKKNSHLLQSIIFFPLHTFLIALYPILFVYSRNLMNIPFQDIIRFLLISEFFFIFLLICFKVVLKDWGKSGLLSSLIAVLFYAFGHVANAAESLLLSSEVDFNLMVMPWIWLAIFLPVSYLIVSKPLPAVTTRFFNLFSLILVSFSIFSVVNVGNINSELTPEEQTELAQLRGEETAESKIEPIPDSELPDIYYIILDGYLRADYLEEYFNIDISPFLDELQQRGFYFVSASRSNYLNTNYSLNSSLNLVYFHEYPKNIFNKSKYNLYNNYLHDFLDSYGYQTVVFDSGTGDTNEQDLDIFVSLGNETDDEDQILNRFEQFFLKTTLGLLLFDNRGPINTPGQPNEMIQKTVNQELALRRDRITHALEHLPEYADAQGHYYLFSHIYSPHIPFLYGPGGTELTFHGNQNLYWYEVPQEDYPEYYGYQIEYLNSAVLDTIDQILSNSTKPVVIVLQADHGDEFFLDRDAPTTQGLEFRSAILNAIYFSDGEYDQLYPSLTPVNTFRIVLNHWFGAHYPLLADQVFFHEDPLSTRIDEKPEFIDCCIYFKICIPPHTQ